MSGFDKRQKGEEAKFALDGELAFKASVRRNKLLGLWVAETFLSKTGEDAQAYAKEVIAADMEKPGVDDVVEFVLKSLEGTGADLSEHRIRHKIEELNAVAMEQIKTEG
ncbi:MAG: DUF1476 domain-containing protein [Nisaea sp.]|jgi:hypothetical protein|uniref:DUF1476 domain-containing protein n=1 Tax=Nisaea sp. TaxID=2024842 RepID=UPI001B0D1DC4|nr:DUF1476 domain-containing protein [Nisaea sp.]MBO6561302.1 DUF1476 domain-containing protein [Nisaea sp.]